MAASRALLVVGPPGSGKTSLIRRFTDDAFHPEPGRTVGVDRTAPSVSLDPLQAGLPERLAALLPPEGLVVELWEMGGKLQDRQRGRGAMRPHGLLACHELGDPIGLSRATHALLNHRLDWHLAHDRADPAGLAARPPGPAAVLCGTKADLGGEGPAAERAAEALELARARGPCAAAVEASALTGQGVAGAFYALLEAVLEAEEEAEAERLAAGGAWPATGAGPLARGRAEEGAPTLTDPCGLSPREPPPVAPAQPELVEVFDGPLAESPYGVRGAAECLQRGLWHRAVHVWLLDARTGGLLLRRHSRQSSRNPGRWGPSCHDSVRCCAPIAEGQPPGPSAAAESSRGAAARALREQLGLGPEPRGALELCFRCPSQAACGDGGTCRELLDVWVLRAEHAGGLLLSLRGDEEAEWVHFLDVFGPAGRAAENLFHMEPAYADAAVQRLRARVLQAGQAEA